MPGAVELNKRFTTLSAQGTSDCRRSASRFLVFRDAERPDAGSHAERGNQEAKPTMHAVITVESSDRRIAARPAGARAVRSGPRENLAPPLGGFAAPRGAAVEHRPRHRTVRLRQVHHRPPLLAARDAAVGRPVLAARPLPARRLSRSGVHQGCDGSVVGGRLLVAAGVAAAVRRSVHRPAVPRHAGPAAGRGAGGAPPPLVVLDEYTSVVDRTVAQIGSAAAARAVREHGLPLRRRDLP